MKRGSGFTIVELLIVIVVIAILAAISVAAYTGINNRAYDSTVQSDLRNIGQKLSLYRVETGAWPVGHGQLQQSGIVVNKDAYGEHYNLTGNLYNMVYCRQPDGSGDVAVVGRSKSGVVFVYAGGSVSEFGGRWSGTATTCADALGVSTWNAGYRDWLFELSAWKSYL